MRMGQLPTSACNKIGYKARERKEKDGKHQKIF